MYMKHGKSIPETNEIGYIEWVGENGLGRMEGVKRLGENVWGVTPLYFFLYSFSL